MGTSKRIELGDFERDSSSRPDFIGDQSKNSIFDRSDVVAPTNNADLIEPDVDDTLRWDGEKWVAVPNDVDGGSF